MSSILSHREAGAGPALVLLHAFPFDSEMWAPQFEAFAQSHRVIAPDLPGFGKSVAESGLTVDVMADRVREFLDSIALTEPVVLGGLSMGGYVALAFARRYPARLRALILADTKADPDDDAAKKGRDQTIETAKQKGTAAVVEPLMKKLLGPKTLAEKPDVVERATAIAMRQSSAGIVEGLGALRDRLDARPGLAKISVPTLIMVGSDDGVTPPVKARELSEGISNSQLVEIPAAGHMSNLEDSAAFNQTTRHFLASLSRP